MKSKRSNSSAARPIGRRSMLKGSALGGGALLAGGAFGGLLPNAAFGASEAGIFTYYAVL